MTAIFVRYWTGRALTGAIALVLTVSAGANALAGPLPTSTAPALTDGTPIVQVRHGRKAAAIGAGVAIGALGAAAAASAASRGYYDGYYDSGYGYGPSATYYGYDYYPYDSEYVYSGSAPVYYRNVSPYYRDYYASPPSGTFYVERPAYRGYREYYGGYYDVPVHPEGGNR